MWFIVLYIIAFKNIQILPSSKMVRKYKVYLQNYICPQRQAKVTCIDGVNNKLCAIIEFPDFNASLAIYYLPLHWNPAEIDFAFPPDGVILTKQIPAKNWNQWNLLFWSCKRLWLYAYVRNYYHLQCTFWRLFYINFHTIFPICPCNVISSSALWQIKNDYVVVTVSWMNCKSIGKILCSIFWVKILRRFSLSFILWELIKEVLFKRCS